MTFGRAILRVFPDTKIHSQCYHLRCVIGTDDLIQWLLDNRGPVIRYRTLRDLAGDGIVIDDETLLRRLEWRLPGLPGNQYLRIQS